MSCVCFVVVSIRILCLMMTIPMRAEVPLGRSHSVIQFLRFQRFSVAFQRAPSLSSALRAARSPLAAPGGTLERSANSANRETHTDTPHARTHRTHPPWMSAPRSTVSERASRLQLQCGPHSNGVHVQRVQLKGGGWSAENASAIFATTATRLQWFCAGFTPLYISEQDPCCTSCQQRPSKHLQKPPPWLVLYEHNQQDNML